MRYQDVIQCAGAEVVAAVRRDALQLDPAGHGDYYALHIRRGDFQFKVLNSYLRFISTIIVIVISCLSKN